MVRSLLIKAVVLLSAFVMTSFADVDDACPVNFSMPDKPSLEKKHGYLYPVGKIQPLEKTADGLPHGWLFNYDDGMEYYLSGGTAGDEWGIWFQSLSACSLYAVEFLFYADKGGGTINLDVMTAGTVTPDTVANPDSIAVEDIFGENLMGETFPLEIAATSSWERFVFPDSGYNIDVGSDIFWIHWEKTGDSPMLLADSDNPGDYLHTWSYEPNQDGDWKWSHYGTSVGIEAMVRCEVVFYGPFPPQVTAIQMNDTYDIGPHTLYAYVDDNSLYPDSQNVVSGTMYYEIDGSETQSVAATVTGGNESKIVLSAELPVCIVGNTIKYWFEAVYIDGLTGESLPLYFEITEPTNTDAVILILDEGQAGYDPYLDGMDEVPLYEEAIIAAGFDSTDYEIWDTPAHHGYDASVIGHGWSTILAFSWGTYSIPTRAYTSGYGAVLADFLNNNGNLLFADMDYFYGNREVDEPDFIAGDFAYDFFGIDAGVNDPGPGADSIYTGVADDVISGDFVSTPVECQFYTKYSWVDFITPRAEANTVFTGESANIGAVSYETANFKTAYFAFNLANVDLDTPVVASESFKTIVGNFLKWSIPDAIGDEDPAVPVQFDLKQNYPNPFNPVTNIKFSLPKDSKVKISIYNILGKKVRTLVNKDFKIGNHKIVWNGKNESGNMVSSGIYIYKLETPGFVSSKKMILMK